ncbi:alpha/beta hydrolase fold [Anaeromyxobacter sp. K]|uniref:YheT family hydrolase n=1 Tax=Anaeromyxobacter sp. (strain K) TaxID=447217 RepID=UPI00015F9F98|nr:alpha/beta fold hydrolase [Anaeromyxobacter sp. K]ACG73660.1 alpha/beta hydrolase fold [Anaeromyxobacter sp. K]
MTAYRPSRWLPGAHAMTVFASVARPLPRPPAVRERWELPDGDFLDVDRFAGPAAGAPVLVVCHGLEGSSRAPYVRGLVALALAHGMGALAMNFRGCSGTPNRLPRFYHSGETGDVDEVVRRLVAERPGRPLVLSGFSLGGNVVAKYLGERGDDLAAEVRGAAVVSVPFDLARSARAIDGPGFWNWVYRERFLRRLRAKALEKAARFPERLDAAAIRAVTTFAGFDGAVTAPLHGFASAEEYWSRCSAGRFVAGVRRPLLALAALDDPMVPRDTLPVEAARANPCVELVATPAGGHVGFVSGAPFRPSFWAELRAAAFAADLARAAPGAARAG